MKRAVALLILAATPVAADQIFLKGGGQLRGVIVERTPSALVIEVGPGRVTLPASRIERVVEGSSALATFHERAARLAADDVAGWLALGQWAEQRDLQTQAREAYGRVLALDPGNAVAHRAFGNVYVGGRWMTEAESYRARGLVLYEGAWVTQAEREAAIRERAAAAAATQARTEADARVREAEARARAAEAEARRAEATARQADATNGIPYPWVLFGGGCSFGCVSPIRPSPKPVATPPPPLAPTPKPAAWGDLPRNPQP